MNLIDENIEKESEEKQKKLTKVIVIAIAVLIAIVVFILAYAAIKKKNTLTVTIDDQKQNFKASLFLMEDKKHMKKSQNGEIYISVRELANMLGEDVGYFNDEYNGKGEDVTKCNIKTENEYTSYISGSSTIYKVRDNKEKNDELREKMKNNKEVELLVSDYEYEYFNIDGGVVYENNEIYATKSAIELGFNVKIVYDEKNKSVKIYTLNGLSQVASNTIGASVVTEDLDYYNKKLLKHGYAVVKNASGDIGIQNYLSYQEGNYVLSCKYSEIKYIEGLSCIIVTTSDKKEKGISKIDIDTGSVTTLVEPVYQEINQVTDDGTLFVIKENDKYGLLSIPENVKDITDEDELKKGVKTIVKCEYQTIGIDDYAEYSEMDNRYLINGKFIPIKLNDKWGLATKENGVIIIPQFDTIGCKLSKKGKPVICVPKLRNDADAIVFGSIYNGNPQQQNNGNETNIEYNYFIVDTAKKERINNDVTASEIYSLYQNNERTYFLTYVAVDGTTYPRNIFEYYGVATKKTNNNQTSNQNNNQNNNQTNNQNSNQNNTQNNNNNNQTNN